MPETQEDTAKQDWITSWMGANCCVKPLYTYVKTSSLLYASEAFVWQSGDRFRVTDRGIAITPITFAGNVIKLFTCWEAFCKFKSGSDDLFKNNLSLFSLGGGSFLRCGLGAWKREGDLLIKVGFSKRSTFCSVFWGRSFCENPIGACSCSS